jgi:hypothetical protein
MKKIGFIDYYINEWHADNYPSMIAESAYAGNFEVALAWEETSVEGRKPIDLWCAEMGIARAESIEQVIEECDCLVVLSPDNPERHEDLSMLPLASGKPVYVDKPFADSFAAARRMVERARKFKTPLMSSSALRFDSTVTNALTQIGDNTVNFFSARGPGEFAIYGIHQIEPMVTLMGVGAKRVMQCGNERTKLMVTDYGDGRRGVVNLIPNCPFQFNVSYGDGGIVAVNDMQDFFARFIDSMLGFFETGESPIPIEQTLEVAALIESGSQALDRMDEWVDVAG